MKKTSWIALLLALVLLAACLTGCAKKASYRLTVEDIGDYTVTQIPKDMESYAQQLRDILVTVRKEKDYPFVVRGGDGQEYAFALRYQNGAASIVTEDALRVTIQEER